MREQALREGDAILVHLSALEGGLLAEGPIGPQEALLHALQKDPECQVSAHETKQTCQLWASSRHLAKRLRPREGSWDESYSTRHAHS